MNKKLYTLIAAFTLVSYTMFAQNVIHYGLDMSNFVGTIDPNGVHIAGNFTTSGSTIPDWTPGDANAGLTNITGSIWLIDITFASANAGDTLQFKFLNGNDWSVGNANIEGQAGTTLLNDACGIGDGFGGYNRYLVVPNSEAIWAAQWDNCGILTPVGIQEVYQGITTLDVYPNPAITATEIKYTTLVSDNVTIHVLSHTGQLMQTLVNEYQSAGIHTASLNTNDLANGMYFIQVSLNGKTINKAFVVNK